MGKFYYEFIYGRQEIEVFDQKLIENVARQMCIVAGLEPDDYVQAVAEDTFTPYEGYVPTIYGPTDVYSPPAGGMPYGQSMNQFTMEKRVIPRVKEVQPTQSFHRWQTFRRAAFMALAGHYAVKQILMVGEPVRLEEDAA